MTTQQRRMSLHLQYFSYPQVKLNNSGIVNRKTNSSNEKIMVMGGDVAPPTQTREYVSKCNDSNKQAKMCFLYALSFVKLKTMQQLS